MSYKPNQNSQTPVLEIPDSVCYLSQNPLIISKTIRENIILGMEENEKRLKWAIKHAHLEYDLSKMDNGLDTVLGENGHNLSGGQRVRVAMARNLYRGAELYLFDDPLSALDLNVGNIIMEKTILQSLKNDTVIITTHAIEYANQADRIIIMDQGKIISDGTYEEMKKNTLFMELKNFYEKEKKDKQQRKSIVEVLDLQLLMRPMERISFEDSSKINFLLDEQNKSNKATHNFFLKEDREYGTVSKSIYKKLVVISLGWFFLLVSYSIQAITASLYVVSNNYLLDWSQNLYGPQTWFNFWIWILLIVAYNVFACLKWLPVFKSIKMSQKIHSKMVFRILHCKMLEFIERIPIGTIINRFTLDMAVVDLEVCKSHMLGLIFNMCRLIIDLIVIVCFTNVFSIVFVICFIITAVYLQRKQMYSKREFVRQESITLSPMSGLVHDVIKGLPEIRAMKLENYFKEKFNSAYNDHIKNSLMILGSIQWFDVRVCLANISIVQIPCFAYFMYMYLYQDIEISSIAMILISSSSVANNTITALNFARDFETNMISMERLSKFEQIEQEKGYLNFEKEEIKLASYGKEDFYEGKIQYWKYALPMVLTEPSIIKQGKISFRNVSAKYEFQSGGNVFTNLSFEIQPREKIGIVGRTGSGKTSLIKLLWRCLDYYKGEIRIDDKEIKNCDLKKLRNEMDLLLQQPGLFKAS